MNSYKSIDYTNNGKCSNCGRCCSNLLPLTDDEIVRIKKYIKKHNIKKQVHNVLEKIDMNCPFRDEINKKCLIYEIRPEICRQFMCNHNEADIINWKTDFNKFRLRLMSNEFYN